MIEKGIETQADISDAHIRYYEELEMFGNLELEEQDE